MTSGEHDELPPTGRDEETAACEPEASVRPLFQGRFEILTPAGIGGSATVYRAQDHKLHQRVALKLLRLDALGQAKRFGREMQLLQSLDTPGIVRFLDGGVFNDGTPYIVMDWAEGETLQAAAKEPLSALSAVRIIRRVAEALIPVHDRDIIHRDIKPANIIVKRAAGASLGDAQITLLDFGIARRADDVRVTAEGARVGTPNYMAPEQARAAPDVDARIDVHALGAVLFRLLTGTPPYSKEDAFATLLSIAVDPPPRPSSLVPECPPELDELVQSLLAKRPERRPADAAAVARLLAALEPRLDTEHVPPSRPPPTQRSATEPGPSSLRAITHAEQRMTSYVVGRLSATWWKRNGQPVWQRIATRFGKGEDEAIRLTDGTVVLSFHEASSAPLQAHTAALAAMELLSLLRDAPIAVLSARVTQTDFLGEISDRAVALLHDAPAGVWVDDPTSRLLGPGFILAHQGERTQILGALPPEQVAPISAVLIGRSAELDTAMRFAVDPDRVGTELRVTGPVGIGKSRLIDELRRHITDSTDAQALICNAGASTAHAFGVIGQLLRALGGTDLEDSLLARIAGERAGDYNDAERRHVAQTIRHLVAEQPEQTPPDLPSELFRDIARRACMDLLRSATRPRRLVVLVDDAQLCDAPSRALLREAASEIPALRVLWGAPDHIAEDAEIATIVLGPLSLEDSRALVRALRPGNDESVIDRIAQKGLGNPLLIEELCQLDGDPTTIPAQSMLALIEARLLALPTESRRVLRAASVFFGSFDAAMLQPLVGFEAARLADHLTLLISSGLLERTREREDEDLFQFRHQLLREAAYSMLTDSDRKNAHYTAGRHLEKTQRGVPSELAEHYLRAGAKDRAAMYMQRAAALAAQGNDLAEAAGLAKRALELSPSIAPREKGALLVILAQCASWTGAYDRALEHAIDAMRAFPRDQAGWFEAARIACVAAYKLGKARIVEELGEQLKRVPEATLHLVARSFGAAASTVGQSLQLVGSSAAEAVIARAADLPDEAMGGDPIAFAYRERARSLRSRGRGELKRAIDELEMAASLAHDGGDLRFAAHMRELLGNLWASVGNYEQAENMLRQALGLSTTLGARALSATIRQNLGYALLQQERPDAEPMLTQALSELASTGDRRMIAYTHCYLAEYRLGARQPSRALESAEAALREGAEHQGPAAYAHAVIARAHLTTGRIGAALHEAERAKAALETAGDASEGWALVQLVYAKALLENGRSEDVSPHLQAVVAVLKQKAMALGDADLQWSYCTSVPAHAELLALAKTHQRTGRPSF